MEPAVKAGEAGTPSACTPMKRIVLALLTVAAASSAAPQAPPQIMVGHPIQPRLPNPPTLPLRQPVRPVGPVGPVGPQLRNPARIVYVPAPYPFYAYQQPAYEQPSVSVNVTNVIQGPPAAVTYLVPMGSQFVGNYAGSQLWDPDADIAASRREPQNVVATADPDRGDRARQADLEDAKSVESIVGALYDVLSGPRGTPRNWDRFRALFTDGARLIATHSESGSPARATVMSPDDYAGVAAPVLERGVFEREVARSVEKFGSIAHVFSTYECRRTSGDAKPYQRGINSIQLLNDGTRWWIVSVSWDAERADNPIPARYLPASR